jgi:hypothetical protein
MSLLIRDSREEIRMRIRVGAERIARFALCCTLVLVRCHDDEALNSSTGTFWFIDRYP